MKLAHASDLHLLSVSGSNWLDFANKRWIGGLNLLSNRGRHYRSEIFEKMIVDINESDIDHLLVTGDITNLALDGEFQFARKLFDQIELGPKQVTVLPGNHDAYIQEGATHYTRHFGPYFEADADFKWDDNDAWPIVRVREGVAIIGLSTSLQTPWFTAYGKIGSKQLHRLRELLVDGRLKDLIRVVAIHHPPAGKPAKSRVRGLHDRLAFADAIASFGCDLILHGHEHRDLHHVLRGPTKNVDVRGIQSGTYDAGPKSKSKLAKYRVYDLKKAGASAIRIDESLRSWTPGASRFM